MYDDLGTCRFVFNRATLRLGQPEKCIHCRECESKCPQQIPISEWMPVVHAVLGEGQSYEEAQASIFQGFHQN
jgi:predicted aldo/keto reductase-like oxidoreductase